MSHTSELGTSLPKTAPETNRSIGASSNPRSVVGLSGSSHYNARLTEQQVIEIFQSTGKASTVAERYSVHENTVRSIRRGDRWASVTAHLRKDGAA